MSGDSPGADPFDRSYPIEGGIVRTLERLPRLSPAQRSNLLHATAALYEPWWRWRSLGLLSSGAVTVRQELEELGTWAAKIGGGRLLDVGTSSGLYARTVTAADPQLEVHALDVSLPFLRRLLALAEREGRAITAVHGDAGALPYRDGSFDAVTSGGTLNELRDPERALAEQARVLRPGGQLWHMYLIGSEQPFGRGLQRVLRGGGLHFFRDGEVPELVDRMGLTLRDRQLWPPVAIARFERRSGPV